ncbi:MAG: ribonuclease P protein component [Lentimicrobiaceae bacterium]|jgi:ribonuclease P protein component|nr:ribonuclease P protein component [Lentimicrobiaceae bacterium]
MTQQQFPKHERLHENKAITTLFEQGNSFFIYPFKVFVRENKNAEKPTLRLLISISKKRFKRAVLRNRIKRLTREGWRQNKHTLLSVCTVKESTIDVALIYTATQLHSFKEIQKKITVILRQITEQYEISEKNTD